VELRGTANPASWPGQPPAFTMRMFTSEVGPAQASASRVREVGPWASRCKLRRFAAAQTLLLPPLPEAVSVASSWEVGIGNPRRSTISSGSASKAA